jgi:DNA polymerase III subunit epsilon
VKIIGLDVESTGLEIGDHRLIEFYGACYRPDAVQTNDLYLRIHPGRAIMPAAQAVHHISITDLEGEPRWEEVAPQIHEFMSGADVFVAHNGEHFDLPFLNYEFKRVGLAPIERPICDTMLQGRWASPVGAVPNLGALCWACEVEYDPVKAHAASFDVQVMMECFFKGLDWGFFELPALVTKETA